MVQTRSRRRKSILGGFRSILTKVGKKKRHSKSKKQSTLPKQPVVSPPNSPPHSSNNSNSQYYTALADNATSFNEHDFLIESNHQFDDNELPPKIQEISVPSIVSPNHHGTTSYDANDKIVDLDLTPYAVEGDTLKVKGESPFNVNENTVTTSTSKEMKEGVHRNKLTKEQNIVGHRVLEPFMPVSHQREDCIIRESCITPLILRNEKEKEPSIVSGEVYEPLLSVSNQIEDRVLLDADSTPSVHRSKNDKERIFMQGEVYESRLSASDHVTEFETEDRIIIDADFTPIDQRIKNEKEQKFVGGEGYDPFLSTSKCVTDFKGENRFIVVADMTPSAESSISLETKNRSPFEYRDTNIQNTISNISFISQQKNDDSIILSPDNSTKSKYHQEVQTLVSVQDENQASLESRDEKDTAQDRTMYSTVQSEDPLSLSTIIPNNCAESTERLDIANEEIAFQSGDRVEIIHGKYQGERGVITNVTPKMVKVKIEGESLEPRVKKSSVKILPTVATSLESRDEKDTTQGRAMYSTVQSKDPLSLSTIIPNNCAESTERLDIADAEIAFQSGDRVEIIHGKYQGEKGVITSVTSKMVKVKIEGESLEPRVKKSSVKILPTVATLLIDNCEHIHDTLSTKYLEDCLDVTVNNVTTHHNELEKQISNNGNQNIILIPSIKTNTKEEVESNNHVITFQHRDRVEIIHGKYQGRKGNVTKTTNKMVYVKIDGESFEPRVNKSSVKILPAVATLNVHRCRSSAIQANSVNSQKALPRSNVRTQSQKRVTSSTIRRRSVSRSNSTSSENEIAMGNPNKWRFPGSRSESAGNKLGTRRISKVRLETKTVEDTFLSHLLGFRTLVLDIPLNAKETNGSFETVTEFNNSKYELVSAKVQADGDVGSTQYQKSKCIRLVYAEVEKNGLEILSLQEELDKIANFSELDPRKVKSRLELFQSPCYKFKNKELGLGIKFLERNFFCEIKEHGNEGCGFISERFLEGLLGGNMDAERTIAIQVRIFIPGMGIFKGMLMRKRSISDSDAPIQLPPSMRKVGPSLHQDRLESEAVLLITQAGVHQNQTNHYVGRLLDVNLKDPPKSFKIKRFQTDMIPRLWQSLGVQKHICMEYTNKSTQLEYLNHAYVVGVADPTGSLPTGHIFVTGMGSIQEEKLFVTRSPCIKACDGRVLSNIIARPAEMQFEDWKWMSTLPFGAIIFANPEEGGTPLPQHIAEGDLDGDLYFVCWNKEILSNIKADPIQQTGGGDGKPKSNKGNKGQPCGDNWLRQAQEFMVDCVSTHELSQLLGKLFSESKKAADKAEQGSFLRNKDAEAFADAFYRLLEYDKHGGTIPLPQHLHGRIPEKFRKYFSYRPIQ